ncbi:MAG: type II secretion system protein N [Limnobacter sp.]|nr:type II secretion system protein N [Limnobacter sp.]
MSTNLWKKTTVMLGVALVVFLFNLPAHLVGGKLYTLSGQRVCVFNTSGTVWSGQAQIGLSNGHECKAVPNPLTWHLVALDSDSWLGIRFDHSALIHPAQLGLSAEGVHLNASELQLPASWLSALGAPFNTIRPEGVLHINWARVNVLNPDLKIEIRWRDAQSALASIRPLGDYLLSLNGHAGKQINLKLDTLNGPLNLQGQGVLQPGQRVQFQGYAWPSENSRAALTGLLSQMGQQDGQRYRLGVF